MFLQTFLKCFHSIHLHKYQSSQAYSTLVQDKVLFQKSLHYYMEMHFLVLPPQLHHHLLFEYSIQFHLDIDLNLQL